VIRFIYFPVAFLVFSACDRSIREDNSSLSRMVILPVNVAEIPKGSKVIALIGATLIDGNGGDPVENSCIVISMDKITLVGKTGDVQIPPDAEVINVKGLTVLPGLIDAHYHNEDSDSLASLFLKRGVTSVRDPGEWIESYDALRASGQPVPRLFLAGPHLDTYPPAYPADSYIVKDPPEAQLAVARFVGQGASVIKAYYGLSIEMIKAICTTSHKYGVPVTAHLEVTNARDAINAGLDGIEHITSLGTCLLPMREAEQYKQKVMADNNARRRGRYEVWSSFNFEKNAAADSLIRFLSEKQTFVSPTLAVFERRADRGDTVEVKGFANMLAFVRRASDKGVRFVVGSHSYVPYAEFGFAYHREMELLHEAGLTNMQVIQAATLENARFFRIEERLGSIEQGKIADLVFVEGDPLKDIKAMRNVKKVMLNGVLVRTD
jgi:imidazolonepropionase-like amidohydrolase